MSISIYTQNSSFREYSPKDFTFTEKFQGHMWPFRKILLRMTDRGTRAL